MDEEVGGLDPGAGAGEAGGVGDVADVELVARFLQQPGAVAVADQAAGGTALRRQRRGQPAADEPGRSGDEGVRRDPLTLAGCKAWPVRIHILERRQRVELPPDRAFAFYGDSANLEPLTPPWLHFEVTTPQPLVLGAGTLLDYRLKLHGVPVRWRTRIETWEPPHRFVDTQAKGPYALWEHTHLFEPEGDGATTIVDRVRYAIPYGPLGALAHLLFVRRDLDRIFDFRRDAVAARLRPA